MAEGESDWKKTLVEKLLDNSPLILVLLGLGTLLLGLGVDKFGLGIHEKRDRNIAAGVGCGMLALGIGAFLFFRTARRKDLGDGKQFGIQITQPQPNETVPARFDLRGSFKKKPPEDVLAVVLEYSPTGAHYYFSRTVVLDETTKQWSAVDLSVGGRKHDERHLVVVLSGKGGQALIDYYNYVVTFTHGKTGNAIKVPFRVRAPDMLECAKLVVRKGD